MIHGKPMLPLQVTWYLPLPTSSDKLVALTTQQLTCKTMLCDRRGGMVWSAVAQRSCVITESAVGIYSRNCQIIRRLVSDCTKKNTRTKGHVGTLDKKNIDNLYLCKNFCHPQSTTQRTTVNDWYFIVLDSISLSAEAAAKYLAMVCG
jgi:hypothetical protein